MSTVEVLQAPAKWVGRLSRPQLVLVVGAVPRLSNAAFMLLVTGILGCSLLGSLVINVALTQGAFTEASLSREVRTIEAQQQSAQQTLAMLGSPGMLESRARAMGMVPAAAPVFLRLSDGTVMGEAAAAERVAQPAAIAELMPQSSFLAPELQMAPAAQKSVPIEPRSDAAVELMEIAP